MAGGVQRFLIGPCVQNRSLRSPLEARLGNCDRLLGGELSRKIHGNRKPGGGSHRMHIQIFDQFRIVFEAIFKEIGTARAIAIEMDQVPDQILPCRSIGLLLRN